MVLNPFGWLRSFGKPETIPVTENEPYYVIKSNRITMENSGEIRTDLLNWVNKQLNQPKDLLIIEVGHLEAIDASGTAVFTEADELARASNKRIGLNNASDSFIRFLGISGDTNRFTYLVKQKVIQEAA